MLRSQEDHGRDLAHGHEARAERVGKRVGLEQPGVEHDREVAEQDTALANRQAGTDSRPEERGEAGERS